MNIFSRELGLLYESFQADKPSPLSEPRVQRIFLGDKSLVNFTVKLSHVGEAKRAKIILRANGQEIFNRDLDLDKQPETMLLQAQWEAEPASWTFEVPHPHAHQTGCPGLFGFSPQDMRVYVDNILVMAN